MFNFFFQISIKLEFSTPVTRKKKHTNHTITKRILSTQLFIFVLENLIKKSRIELNPPLDYFHCSDFSNFDMKSIHCIRNFNHMW